MFPSIGAQGKIGFITVEMMELGDTGMLGEALGGGGDYEGTCGWDYEDSLRLEVLARFSGGGLSTSCV